ncbi:MAG: hypothetical protein HW387_80 [Parachlamydiales bacterium]|nr:hypothetical protein [Parachlamydiales bacterium]
MSSAEVTFPLIIENIPPGGNPPITTQSRWSKIQETVRSALSAIASFFARLFSLPDDIALLTNLRSLYLQGTQLIKVPRRLGTLAGLVSLNLLDTLVTDVPTPLKDLPHLTLPQQHSPVRMDCTPPNNES